MKGQAVAEGSPEVSELLSTGSVGCPAATLQGMIDNMRHGIALFGPDRRLIAANRLATGDIIPSALQSGMTLEEAVQRMVDAGVTGNPALDRELADQALRLDRSRPHRYVRPAADGRVIEVTSDALPDGGFIIVHADITAQTRAETEARQRADLLQTMLDNCRHGMLLFGPDRHIVAVNALAPRVCGLAEADMQPGRTLAEVLAAHKAMGVFGSGAEADAKMEQLLHVDRSKQRRDQRIMPDGRIVELTSDPTPDGGFVVTYTDVTARARAEEAAQQRSTLLRQNLESMRHGIAMYGPDHRLLIANDLFGALMGLDASDIRPGALFADMVTTQLARGISGLEAGFMLPADAAPIDGQRDRTRHQWHLPDGMVREVSTDPTPDGGFVITVSDITALARAEAEARERATLLEVTQESMRHGLMLYDQDGLLLAANRLAAQLNGLPPGCLAPGRSLPDIVQDMVSLGRFSGAEAAAQLLLPRAQAHRQILNTPEGSVLEVISDPTPQGGFVLTYTDVTQLVQARMEAQRRAGMLQVMLDNMRHGIALFDAEGTVLAANAFAAEMCGLTADEMVPGAALRSLRRLQIERGEYGYEPATTEGLEARLDQPLLAPDSYVRLRPNGSVREVTTDRTPDGGYVRVYSDITEDRRIRAELERAKDAAEAANLAKSRFLATMSHELRTPLNAVIGFSEAIIANPDPAAVRDYIRPIHEAGRHLLSLIDDILDVARAETSGFRVTEDEVDLLDVSEGSVRVMQATADAAQVRIISNLPQHLPHLLADELRLRQVLLNLLSNAVKFTEAGGTVTLSAELAPDGDLLLRVTDTGIGIKPEDIPRAFEPFTQLDASRARRFPGSGLGLYLSKALAEAQGATLGLESDGIGGTSALLRFPKSRLLTSQSA